MENLLSKLESDINAYFLRVFNVSTPGTDLLFRSEGSEIMWGRSGNDTFVGLKPGDDHFAQPQMDIILGDADFMAALEGSQLRWDDRFVLGDWKQPYYTSSKGLDFGLKQFATILDFNPWQDVIQL
ncbi:hypothetical protein [Fischerella thermalis]|nr:hypothetical protein [Fischerella thermalis]